MAEPQYYYAVGRRKCAVAQARVVPGDGRITINGKSAEAYFGRPTLEVIVMQPLALSNQAGTVNITVKVVGGGLSGQAGAVRHAIARALVEMAESSRVVMRRGGLLTRDARVKERKKYGLKRARKAPQYTKR